MGIILYGTEENGRKVPDYSGGQKKRLFYRGRKRNEFLLATIEQTFAPGTIYGWYRELVGRKYDSTEAGQMKRGRKPLSQEIVYEVLLLVECSPDRGTTTGLPEQCGISVKMSARQLSGAFWTITAELTPLAFGVALFFRRSQMRRDEDLAV